MKRHISRRVVRVSVVAVALVTVGGLLAAPVSAKAHHARHARARHARHHAASVHARVRVTAPYRPAPPLSFAERVQAMADRPDPSTRRSQAPPPPSGSIPAGSWHALGPAPIGPPYQAGGGFYGGVNSGRITGATVIASGSLAGRIVTATAGGGIWTSDDNGLTWTARTEGAATLAIGSVTVDPSNPNHLVAGTGEANQSGDSAYGTGILTSTDGGSTWSLSDPGGVFSGTHIAQVAIDPSNSSRMFAATDVGLFVTTNGGASWAKPAGASYTAVDGVITSVVIDPATPTTIYIGGGAATVAASTDGGVTWAAANTGITAPSSGPLVALGLAASSPSTLYASIGTGTDPAALYKTTDGAGSWSALTVPDYTGNAYAYGSGSGEQGWYDNVVAVDPTNADHVLAGGETVVESTDGGSNWSNVNGQAFFGPGTNLIHPDQHALAFAPDGNVWIGDDGGMFLYDPSTTSVTNANGNLNVTQFYYGFNEVGGSLLAGSQDNGTASTSSASLSAWTGIWGGDGGPSAITPNDPAIQFIEADQDLYVTTDAFASTLNDITPAALITGSGDLANFTPPMAVVANTATPSQPTVFYGGQDLWRTTDPTAGTPIWTQVTFAGQNVSAIAVSPTNPNVVYAGFVNGIVEVSTDGGMTFTALASQPFSDTFVTGLSVDPSNPQALVASVSYNDTRPFVGDPHVAQYAYTTSPGAGSWTVITGNLPDPGAVSRVVYDGGSLVAATDAGVYATGSPAGSGTSWFKVGAGLPAVQVQDLFVDATTGTLYAITHGRGAWALPSGSSSCVGFCIVTKTLPPATRGTKYTVHLQATGGRAPYKWKLIAGALPKGVKLRSNGILSGNPKSKGVSSGTYTFTVQASTKKAKGNPVQTATQRLVLTLL